MECFNDKKVLVSGASMAGLCTAYWLNLLGYGVTVVEIASQPRTAGGAVDIKGPAIEVARRMGIYEQLKSHGLGVDLIEFKNADDVTENSILTGADDDFNDEIEIERDKFVGIVLAKLQQGVVFMFNNSITSLIEITDGVEVSFRNGERGVFDLVIGCDGIHSVVRKLWFGEESAYSHFMNGYFSISIVPKLLIKQRTMQMFNVPDRAVTLNAYGNKTDVIFCFFSEKEIPYDYRDVAQQRAIIMKQFEGQGWKTTTLLEEVRDSDNFYFDKFCQIKMPSWTKGRVALVGDAGYCASPAAGMGASLSMEGAAVLADALLKYEGDFEPAFRDYNQNLRPFIEEIQAIAELNVRENFIPRTEEAIRKRNMEGF